MLNANAPYTIVSVVTPETNDPSSSGKVINYPCAPTISHDILELAQDGSGQYLVSATYSMKGYIREIDLLAREQDKDPVSDLTGKEKLALHLDYHRRAQRGERVGNYPKEWLSLECRRRQAVGETNPEQAYEDAKRTAPVTAKLSKGGKAVE